MTVAQIAFDLSDANVLEVWGNHETLQSLFIVGHVHSGHCGLGCCHRMQS